MSTPAAGDLKPGRLRLWSNWLWILAAILGTAVLWSAARLIHDQRIRREALRSLAQDKATEVANLGTAKFRLLIGEALGPSWGEAGLREDFLAGLAQAQIQRVACRCRETLPIRTFFRFDASRAAPFDATTEKLRSAPEGVAAAVPDSTLLRIARAQFDIGMREPTPVTDVEIVEDEAVVTVTRPARSGPGTKVYGAIIPVAGLAATLFGTFPREMLPGPETRGAMIVDPVFMHGPEGAHALHIARHRRLVALDTLGLRVAAGSSAVYGAVADRPYIGTAVLPRPLEEFSVFVSLMSSQVSLSVLMPIAHDRLWWNGILIVATIVVCLFAIGSSRREVALARARSDFVAGVSHDLRMPLAQILLATETLSMGRDRNETERKALTASVLREGRRLKAMIDNVLLFSRSGAVGLAPRLHAVEISPLFEAVADSVQLAVADAGQTIHVSDNETTRVIADRALLHQALVNLVDNAMKYGPAGQQIRLRTERAGQKARLIVEDDGPGIPADARKRLFEPYERLDRDATSERTGSGLGLAVTRQIVLACGGDITIEDADKGSRIVITLPLAA